MSQLPTLDYALPARGKPPPEGLWRTSRLLSLVSSAVGLGLLALYALTKSDMIVILGMGWLIAGYLMTLIAFCCGVIYCSVAMYRRFPPPLSVTKAMLAVALPICTAVIALFCFWVGADLAMDRGY